MHVILAMLAVLIVQQDFPKVFILLLQLLGQLSNGMPSKMTNGLKLLLTQAQTWCEHTPTPLIVPQSHCIPFPGSELKKILNVNLVDNVGKCIIKN